MKIFLRINNNLPIETYMEDHYELKNADDSIISSASLSIIVEKRKSYIKYRLQDSQY